LGDDGGVNSGSAVCESADGGAELVDVGAAVLEQVADLLDAVGEEFHRVAQLDVLREDKDGDLGELAADLSGCADAFVASST
jgi:dihydroorotate dehydrogenase